MAYGSILYGGQPYGGLISFTSSLSLEVDRAFMQVWINGADRTSVIKRNSKKITRQLQQRTNNCSFIMFDNFPDAYDEVRVFYSAQIRGYTSDSVILNIDLNCNDLYRVGDSVYVAIEQSYERAYTIQSIQENGDFIELTFTENLVESPNLGDYAGKLIFGGVVLTKQDYNKDFIDNQEASIKCVDFTKIFDKKNVNDTYEDVDGRYIINSFCNDTINKNDAIDTMNYASDVAIQAEWIESGDGDNPTIESSDIREGTAAGDFSWTNSGGTATFSATPASKDISSYTGTSSGTPSSGRLGFWYKATDITKLTSFVVRLGSDSSNYAAITVTPTTTDWAYSTQQLKDATITGAPDWTAVDYLAVVITETDDSNILMDGFRVLETKFFNHYPYVQDTPDFDDFRVSRVKPMEVMQRIADTVGFFWHIDDERNIHLYSSITTNAPFELSTTSDNFNNLSINYDLSNLINSQVVEGGEQTSTSTYSQVQEGDGVVREWILKNKFKNLVVSLDLNASTDTMEAGTTTTTVNATAHGLSVGDYITNRTRSNAVRKVLTVPTDDQFTVDAVTAQTNGDTFSLYVAQTVGIENINEDSGNDFMSNFNEKSIRNADGEDTLVAGEFILFQYNEVVPILVQITDAASITAMQTSLGYSDGIFDGEKIVDKSIKSRDEATSLAQAKLDKYSNTIFTASFQTDIHGLEEGMQVNIIDTTNNRNIDQYFLIQKVAIAEVETGYMTHKITASSLLFGMLELLQQLLKQDKKLQIDENLIVDQIASPEDTIEITDAVDADVDGELLEEDIEISDSVAVLEQTPPFKYGPAGSPQGVWNISEWA